MNSFAKGFVKGTILCIVFIGGFFLGEGTKEEVIHAGVNASIKIPPDKMYLRSEGVSDTSCGKTNMYTTVSPGDTAWVKYSGDTLYILLDSVEGCRPLEVMNNIIKRK